MHHYYWQHKNLKVIGYFFLSKSKKKKKEIMCKSKFQNFIHNFSILNSMLIKMDLFKKQHSTIIFCFSGTLSSCFLSILIYVSSIRSISPIIHICTSNSHHHTSQWSHFTKQTPYFLLETYFILLICSTSSAVQKSNKFLHVILQNPPNFCFVVPL